MRETDRGALSPRLAALMEQAKAAFERSRRVVDEARQVRAMAESKRSGRSAQGMSSETGTDPREDRAGA